MLPDMMDRGGARAPLREPQRCLREKQSVRERQTERECVRERETMPHI